MKKSFHIKKVYSKSWTETVNTKIECPILADSPFEGNAGIAGDDGEELNAKEIQYFDEDNLLKNKKVWKH